MITYSQSHKEQTSVTTEIPETDGPPQSLDLNIIKSAWDYMKIQKHMRQTVFTELFCTMTNCATLMLFYR